MDRRTELKNRLAALMEGGLSPEILHFRLSDSFYRAHGISLPRGDVFDMPDFDELIIEKILVLLPDIDKSSLTDEILKKLDDKT